MTQPARSRTPLILALAGGAAAVFLGVLAFFVVYQWDSSPTPGGPPVTIASCDHSGDETRVGFTVKNPGTEETSYRLQFRILDAGGAEISKGSEYVGTVDPGETADDAITLRHVGSAGASCEYLGVE